MGFCVSLTEIFNHNKFNGITFYSVSHTSSSAVFALSDYFDNAHIYYSDKEIYWYPNTNDDDNTYPDFTDEQYDKLDLLLDSIKEVLDAYYDDKLDTYLEKYPDEFKDLQYTDTVEIENATD